MIFTTRAGRLLAARACGAAAVVVALAVVAPLARGDELPPSVDPVAAAVEPAPEEESAIRAGVEQVQRALGGSVVDRFPTLQRVTDAPTPTPGGSPRRMFRRRPDSTASRASDPDPPEAGPPPQVQAGWSTAPVGAVGPAVVDAPGVFPATFPTVAPGSSTVDALRVAAAELDASANRLENLELYESSDALRRLAQELRLDARQLAKSERTSAAAPAPAGF